MKDGAAVRTRALSPQLSAQGVDGICAPVQPNPRVGGRWLRREAPLKNTRQMIGADSDAVVGKRQVQLRTRGAIDDVGRDSQGAAFTFSPLNRFGGVHDEIL